MRRGEGEERRRNGGMAGCLKTIYLQQVKCDGQKIETILFDLTDQFYGR